MNKQQAIDLVRNTFESPFSREHFANFIGRLLNQIELDPFAYTGKLIPDAFRAYVRQYERLGKYRDAEGHRVDVLIVYLQRETAVERARATQRRFIAGYLQGKYGSSADKDAALVAFVSSNNRDDWRFSLVKLETRLEATAKGRVKAVDEFTPARRWSFLVGAHEKSHTAQTRLVPIMQQTERNPTLAQLEEAFNIEKVTKEFFEKYRDLFIRTKAELDKAVAANPKAQADLAAKGVDTVNLAKKLLGQIVFLYYLQKKGWFGVPRDGEWGDGSKQFLRELFDGKHGRYANFFNDILEHLFYDALRNDRSHDDHYYGRFNCRIPFLNGGLFDPMGNYDWVRADILLPNDLFSNQNKTKEGDTGDGILDIFDRYNFTVQEDEPLEKEVAIDPELLGKAYEKFNAIRPDNYAEFVAALASGRKGEESKFNKQYGVYYTPREIVHYMCRQSLIYYLTTALDGKVSQEELTLLIEQGEAWRENDARVVKKGEETRDYPWLAPAAIREHAALTDEKLAAITVCDPAVGSGAFPVGMMSEMVRARQTLTTYLAVQTPGVSKNPWGLEHRSPYAFKRAAIEHALYGVDIDPGAVEIAKLRLWLSLIVEEEDIRQIKPLPNLDYKIVCGNSLIGFPDSYQTTIGQEISDLIRQHINETNVTRKNELKAAIDAKIEGRYANSQRALGYAVNFDFRTVFADVFQQNGGFDVVIGNPPYGYHQIHTKLQKTYFKDSYISSKGSFEHYFLFYEKGLKLLNYRGNLHFITPVTWLTIPSALSLRQFVLSNYFLAEICWFFDKVFDQVGVNTSTSLILKSRQEEADIRIYETIKDFPTEPTEQRKLSLAQYTKNGYYIGIFEDPRDTEVLSKISNMSVPLQNYAKPCSGYNPYENGKGEAPEGGLQTKETVKNKPYHSEIKLGPQWKPELVGKNLSRFYYEFSGNRWVKYGPWLAAHRDPNNFLGKRILVQEITGGSKRRIIAAYTEEEIYYSRDIIPIKTDHDFPSPLYLLALINSQLLTWYHHKKNPKAQKALFPKVLVSDLKNLPIRKMDADDPKATEIHEEIVHLVNRIMSAKQTNPQTDTRAWEAEIDRHVYALYGLTEAEIAIVEGRAS
jgi:hypothetical protein